MKKILTILLSFCLIFSCLSFGGCSKTNQSGVLTIYAPDGAPALALAKQIVDNDNFKTGRVANYKIVKADVIGSKVIQGTGDIVILPVNAATKLYNQGAYGKYKMVSVITHGNLYIMSSAPITLNDLSNKTMGVIGQGQVPDLTLKSILINNSIANVNINYYTRADEMIPMLKTGKLSIGLLPEPAASQLEKVASNITWHRLSVQELYDSQTKEYPQAVVLVKESLLNLYPNLVENMKVAFTENITYLKENVSQAVNAVNSRLEEGVSPSLNANTITSKVIDNCNIFWQDAVDSKDSVIKYVKNMININSISTAIPADDYFYVKEN